VDFRKSFLGSMRFFVSSQSMNPVKMALLELKKSLDFFRGGVENPAD
jgi:hypothetical protein